MANGPLKIKILRWPLCLALAAVLLAAPGFAADQCYSSEELRAEQVLRLDSELMVITLTCKQGSKGQSLPAAYGAFMRNNADLLRQAEATLIHYYGICYGDSGVSHLDTLRTKLGNEASQEVADVSAPIFCAQHRDRVLWYYLSTGSKLQAEVTRMMQENKSYGRLCESAAD